MPVRRRTHRASRSARLHRLRLQFLAVTAFVSLPVFADAEPPLVAKYALGTFNADVTVPIGHPLMGGGITPAKEIVDLLYARGFVLCGSGTPIVFVAVDWCEIRNDAYDRWRGVLADAAGTTPDRVLVTSVHVHDAPVADLEAERILREHGRVGSVCDPVFHEIAVQRVASAVRESMRSTREITHLGLGQAKVESVASNRRFVTDDGRVSFGRMSVARDPVMRAKPEGTIDPWLKTLSFWNDAEPVAAASFFATHPMSYYGSGGVSADFVGIARQRRQADDPKVFQIYVSGCSGNVTAGKYNDGSAESRVVLAERVYRAMREAWDATQRHAIQFIRLRAAPLRLEPRNDAGFSRDELVKRLNTDATPFGQCLSALGLSWRNRADPGGRLSIPAIDFGPAQLVLLPAEAYVEYQIFAQQLRPGSFVAVAGYGDCAPGYIPTEKHWTEGDANLHDWCWVAPGAEQAMRDALKSALAAP